MSNILPKDSSKVIYTQKLIDSKKFDNFAKITLRVTETGPSRIPYSRSQHAPEFGLVSMKDFVPGWTAGADLI